MNKLALISSPKAALTYTAPNLISAEGHRASKRFVEFFTANIRNPNTRDAYVRAVLPFCHWCDTLGLTLTAIEPLERRTSTDDATLAAGGYPRFGILAPTPTQSP